MALKTVEALIEMGVSSSLIGIGYIKSAMELYDKHGAPFTNMKLVYFKIAEDHKTTSDSVMNAISKAIDYAYEKGDKSEVVKYFGLSRRSNGNHLAFLYNRLKEEESARNKNK
jgi:hypothetical protein